MLGVAVGSVVAASQVPGTADFVVPGTFWGARHEAPRTEVKLEGPVSRILSADGSPHLRGDHLSRRTVTRSLQQPTRRLPACEAKPHAPEGTGRAPPRAFPSAWPLLPMGLPGRAGYPARRWSLTPPFHPYGHGGRPWFADVSVALSAGRPARGLPGIAPYGVRTFLGLAACAAGPRPLGPLKHSTCVVTYGTAMGSRQCQDGAGLPHSVPARQNDTHSSPCEVPEPSQGLRTLECANSRTSSQGAETLRAYPVISYIREET